MSYSSAWGLLFKSEIDTGFEPARPGEHDVEVRIAELPERPADETAWWTASSSEATIWMDGFATFSVRAGKEIVVHPHPQAALEDVALFMRTTPMGALLHQRALVPLHASAVDTPEGAVLILGRKGDGKSTWAAALEQRGYPVLSDDMAVLRWSGEAPELLTAGTELKLHAASLAHLKIEPRRCLPIRPGLPKFHYWCNSRPHGERRPVRAMFLLRLSEPVEREIALVTERNAVLTLSSLIYRNGIGVAGLNRILHALARTAPMYSITSPQGLEHLEDGLERLVAELEPKPEQARRSHWSQSSRLPWVGPAMRRAAEKPCGFVALASFPKSGNTWVRALLTAWRQETQLETDIAQLDGGGGALDSHTFEEELGVNPDYLQLRDELPRWRTRLARALTRRLGTPVPVKLHEDCVREPGGELVFPPDAMVGVILIVRCPLDVAPSHANHYSKTIDEAIASMRTSSWMHLPSELHGSERIPHPIGGWSEHARSWLDESENRLLLVRYEDLLADTVAQFKRIIEFIDRGDEDDLAFRWDEARGQRAVDICRFDRLKSREQDGGFRERLRGADSFFHKGKSGGWRESLTPEQALRICQDHEEMMRRLGYGAEVDEVTQH